MAARERIVTWSQVSRTRAIAEAAEWTFVRDGLDQAEVEAAGADDFHAARVVIDGAVLDLATETGWSEWTVRRRGSAAGRLLTHGGLTWLAFQHGDVDAVRAQEVADAIGRLGDDAHRHELDRRAAHYASTHSIAELRRWLKKLVARLEPQELVDQAEQALAGRSVETGFHDDGMGWVYATLPAPVVAAIEAKLERAARRLDSSTPDAPDERTHAQKRADLFAAWLTHGDDAQDTSTFTADVAVTFTAEALAGAAGPLLRSYDGQWVAPIDWLARFAGPDDPQVWQRVIRTPTGDLLTHDFVGRFFPRQLRSALMFQHEVCDVDGCTTPARSCDLDHQIPHPRGPTAARNGRFYDRRHHRLKGHGGLVPLLDGDALSYIRPSGMERRLADLLA